MIKQFCESILQLNIPNSKALANSVMGLSSQTNAQSVVEISESACYHYQFSSLSKSIGNLNKGFGRKEGLSRGEIEKKLLRIKRAYFAKPNEKFWLLNTDSSPLFRPHSPTLPNRCYVYKPNNQIRKNRPVEVGYEFSCIGLSSRRALYGLSEPSWNLPLSMQLVPSKENKNSFTANQVNRLLDNKELPFHKELTVNALDSNYATPEYIEPTYEQPYLVNIIRLASNRNVWAKLSRSDQVERKLSNEDNRGANAIYGEKYKLSKEAEWERDKDSSIRFGVKLKKKKYLVEVNCWEDMKLRSKRGKNMKDKSFRLIQIKLLNEQGEPVFKRALWISVWGQKNKELTLEEIYWAYRHRFDIEHFFRFGKQKLLLNNFETPIEENMGNWLEIVSLAYWMLWVGKDESKYTCPKWQKYDKSRKNRVEHNLMPSPSEVQRQLVGIILSFEQTAFLPKPRKKGKGRQKEMKLPKKKRYPVIKKGKKVKKQVET